MFFYMNNIYKYHLTDKAVRDFKHKNIMKNISYKNIYEAYVFEKNYKS